MKQSALGRFLMVFYPAFVFLLAITAWTIAGNTSGNKMPPSSFFGGAGDSSSPQTFASAPTSCQKGGNFRPWSKSSCGPNDTGHWNLGISHEPLFSVRSKTQSLSRTHSGS